MPAPDNTSIELGESKRNCRRTRQRVIVLSLLTFSIVVALAIPLWKLLERRRPVLVEALLPIRGEQLVQLFSRPTQRGDRTQVAVSPPLFKHYEILNSAFRSSSIENLPILAQQPEPMRWVQAHLHGQIVTWRDRSRPSCLAIQIRGTRSESEDLRKLVDAVTSAYDEELVSARRQRQLLKRDLVARVIAELRDEIAELRRMSLATKPSDPATLPQGPRSPQLEIRNTQLADLTQLLETIDAEIAGEVLDERGFRPAVVHLQ